MDTSIAKQTVIRAGKQLLHTGLIARTWGNISCRISDTQFVITPSGRQYDNLTEDEIVVVNIEDCSYEGDVKPSSEKGIHADCYKLRSDVNFVIHTHQTNASVVSIIGQTITPEGINADIIGGEVPCAAYGLPGTGKLRKGVRLAVHATKGNAVIMAHHGALCMGVDYDEAFKVAAALEETCSCFIAANRFPKMPVPKVDASVSERNGDKFTITQGDESECYLFDNVPEGEAGLHAKIYRKYPKFNSIIHTADENVVEMSMSKKTTKPLLDDFAQLIGTKLKCANEKNAAKKLKGKNAVLLKDNGALCCAGNMSDAQATEMVLIKGCKTYLDTLSFGKMKPINSAECTLMRVIYLKKYSKKAQ